MALARGPAWPHIGFIEMKPSTNDSLLYYQRKLAGELEREAPEGVSRKSGRLEGDHMGLEPKLKYKLWQIDSLLFAIDELLAGRAICAFRGIVQASGYAGKLEGMGAQPYNTTLSDAFSTIKNAIEDAIGGAR